MVDAPAKAAPASPLCRPSNRMRALQSLPRSCVAAYALAIAAALVRLPAAATPTRSSRLRRALATTSSGSCSNESPRTNAGTSAGAATELAPRSPSAIAISRSDQSVGLEKSLGHFFGCLLVDVDTGVELRHDLVVELRRHRIQRIGELRVLVQDFLAYDGRQVVGRAVVLVVLEHDEVERGNPTVGCEHDCRIDLVILQRVVG